MCINARLCVPLALACLDGKFVRVFYNNRRQKPNYIQDAEVLFFFFCVLNRA